MARRSKKQAIDTPEQPIEPVVIDQEIQKSNEATNKGVEAVTQRTFQSLLHPVYPFALRVRSRYWQWRWWSIPATVATLLLLNLVFPLGGRSLIGFVVTRDTQFTVVDAATGRPVTNATIQDGTLRAASSMSGVAHLRVPIGMTDITVTKQYYRDASLTTFVLFGSSYGSPIRLTAIGRQVPVKVTNKISGKPVAGVTITALHSQATTDKNGEAVIVLPVGVSAPKGTITGKGFNQLDITVQVTDQAIAANTFTITPAGNIYFLSNLSGKIDVVKTNLDGTNRKTVVAGTGFENQYATALLASKDWKYLAFYSQRKANGRPEINLIDTNTDSMSTIDEGSADFILDGWDGDSFIYQVNRNNVPAWQNGQQAIKSFDATNKKITILAQTNANGDQYGYTGQRFAGVYVLGNKVVYALDWELGNCSSSWYNTLSSQQATLNSVYPDGSGYLIVKGFSYSNLPLWGCGGQLSTTPYETVNSLAISFSLNNNQTFYAYEDGKVTVASNITNQSFYSQNYPTYLSSPSGNNVFWSIYADGKNNLTIGDQDGKNAQTIAAESDFSPYGWYSDDYLLVQKSGSELYIVPVGDTSHPYKISNYYKPQNSYYGYGGGYGGL